MHTVRSLWPSTNDIRCHQDVNHQNSTKNRIWQETFIIPAWGGVGNVGSVTWGVYVQGTSPRHLRDAFSPNLHSGSVSEAPQRHLQLQNPWTLSVILCYVLAPSKSKSGRLPTYDNVHACWPFSAASLRKIISSHVIRVMPPTGAMTRIPTESQYPDTELSSPCSILTMGSARLGRAKYQFYKSLVWLGWDSNSQHSAWEAWAIMCSHP